MKYASVTVVLGTLISIFGCAVESNDNATSGASVGSASGTTADATIGAAAGAVAAKAKAAKPKVALKIMNYEQIMELVASHKGKIVVMDAWSTSCPPCIKEFPNLVALHRKYGPEKVACVSLSFDYEGLDKPEEVAGRVLEFLTEQEATFDNVISNVDSETLCKKLNLASIPAVYVYKQDGTLAKRFDNENAAKPEDAFNYEHVGKLVEELVAGAEN